MKYQNLIEIITFILNVLLLLINVAWTWKSGNATTNYKMQLLIMKISDICDIFMATSSNVNKTGHVNLLCTWTRNLMNVQSHFLTFEMSLNAMGINFPILNALYFKEY